ncbi:MAG: DUF885 domain-containing protein [Chloroflexi bacterium]|nr:MAG: DUF885 domain-containing protein [Chloroflexota bacterium]
MDVRALVEETLDGYFGHYPVAATEAGNHTHDDRWPDLTDAGRSARLAFLADAEARLAGLESAGLTRDEAIDLRILLAYLRAAQFNEATLQEDRWSPMSYVYLFGNGLFPLIARPFAPPAVRLRSVAARLRALPAALELARAALEHPGERPVSAFHAERAVATMPGVADLARTALAEAQATGDPDLVDELRPAVEAAVGAVEAHTAWLRDDLLPRATGGFRLGAELYEQKFRHALKSDRTPEDLKTRAAQAFIEVRAEMVRLARDLWSDWVGSEPPPADDGTVVRGVLDAIATDHPRADELLDFCRAENARIEAFIGERDLLGLTDEPLEIVWTPQFLRAFGGAMLIPPGPLDRGLSSFFAITPTPDEWSDVQKESYLREDNARMLRLLTIHEAVPGHYTQLAYSNRSTSPVRAIFQSGVFAEGWAVYVTQVMMDIGYGSDDSALMLVHWKFYLRSITNALMDIGIHAGQMEREEAMRLMVEDGFQEEAEAANKWDRARLSSTQLCEYFLGSVEMHDLEATARKATASDGGEFRYRPFLESVLAHGTPPTPIIREILFGS